MRYRKLDARGDMIFGHGSADYYRDQPEAVAQAAVTRLRLKLGEWFADTSDGTNWDGAVLGRHTEGRLFCNWRRLKVCTVCLAKSGVV